MAGKLSLTRRVYRTFSAPLHEYLEHWDANTSQGQPIIGRFACLGRELLVLSGLYPRAINIQKGRVDYLLQCLSSPHLRARPWAVTRHLNGDGIFPCIYQQAGLKALQQQKPSFLFMDSYSELTDQLFRHKKDGWLFASNYNDVIHDAEFDRHFECLGLLDINLLERNYSAFFDFIRIKHPGIPILFVHFPIKLEQRQKFRDRYFAIREVIENMRTRLDGFFSFSLEDPDVVPPNDEGASTEDFPYHYGRKTYTAFLRQLNATNLIAPPPCPQP